MGKQVRQCAACALGEQREPRFLRRFAALGPLEWVNMRLEVKHGLRMALMVSETKIGEQCEPKSVLEVKIGLGNEK